MKNVYFHVYECLSYYDGSKLYYQPQNVIVNGYKCVNVIIKQLPNFRSRFYQIMKYLCK